MITFQYHVTGTAPLIMENKRMSDPMDPVKRELAQFTKMMKKTDDVYFEISKREIKGGIYTDAETGKLCIPDYVWRGFFVSTGGAAKKFKEGQLAKRGLVVEGNSVIDYDGPHTWEEMWEQNCYRVDMMKIQGKMIRRTRPVISTGWKASPVFVVDEDVVLDPENTVAKWMDYGGRIIGLMGWRPSFGRFQIDRIDIL